MTEQPHSKSYWRGYVDGAEDARNRRNTSTGPNAPWGNVGYDTGYAHGWRAEALRLATDTPSARDQATMDHVVAFGEALAAEYGPATEVATNRWRFPRMMSVETFGTIIVTAGDEAAARQVVALLVAQGDACAKRLDDTGMVGTS